MMHKAPAQRGIALIMVLLAMALMVIMAAGMVQQQSVRIFRAGHYMAQNQGQSIALGAESFARQILYRDFEEDRQKNLFIDSPDEPWARYSVALPVDSGLVEMQVDDLGGRINLNDLVDASGSNVNQVTRDRIARLLIALEVTTVNVDSLIDWVDSNDETVSAYGAEDGAYLLQSPAYRAANQPFVSVTELRLLDGISLEDYRRLRPHLAALPVTGLGINVNMASAAVLQSLHEAISPAQAEAVVVRRQQQRFQSIDEFLALPEFAGLGLGSDRLTVQTRFFEVVSRITYDDRTVNLVSTLYRSAGGQLATVHRDFGQKNRITKERFGLLEEGS